MVFEIKAKRKEKYRPWEGQSNRCNRCAHLLRERERRKKKEKGQEREENEEKSEDEEKRVVQKSKNLERGLRRNPTDEIDPAWGPGEELGLLIVGLNERFTQILISDSIERIEEKVQKM